MNAKKLFFQFWLAVGVYFALALAFRIYRYAYPEKFGNYLPKFNLDKIEPNELVEVLNQEPTLIEYFFMPAERVFMLIGF